MPGRRTPARSVDEAIPYESRVNRELRHRQELARIERRTEQIAGDSGADMPAQATVRREGRTAGDEAQLLRGIPVVGVRGGLGGAILGTRPDSR